MSTSTSNGNGISQRKLEANRANAQKSTGPRTDAGKRRSSLNAQTHGLRARLSTDALVCQHEREDFQLLADALHEELNPQSPLQHLLAERLALLAWKMRRTAAAEAALLDKDLARDRKYRQHENDKKLRRNPGAKIKPLPTAPDGRPGQGTGRTPPPAGRRAPAPQRPRLAVRLRGLQGGARRPRRPALHEPGGQRLR